LSSSNHNAQLTVLRMMSGGSVRLRMMMAFPRRAWPIVSSPLAVVRVNSSMFLRVPARKVVPLTNALSFAHGVRIVIRPFAEDLAP